MKSTSTRRGQVGAKFICYDRYELEEASLHPKDEILSDIIRFAVRKSRTVIRVTKRAKALHEEVRELLAK